MVQSDIHHPTDNTLLWDVVRVVTRLIGRLAAALERRRIKGFCDRTRAARRRMLAIQRMTTTQRHHQQSGKYRELIGIAEEVIESARTALRQTRKARGYASAGLAGALRSAGRSRKLRGDIVQEMIARWCARSQADCRPSRRILWMMVFLAARRRPADKKRDGLWASLGRGRWCVRILRAVMCRSIGADLWLAIVACPARGLCFNRRRCRP